MAIHDTGACTTLGHLVYPARPPFNFARLVADLDAALAGLDVPDRELGWDHDDVAFLDIGSSRIALAIAEGQPGREGTIVTVSVGLGPRPGQDTRLADRRDTLAHLIADRICVRFRPGRTIWSEVDAVATPDLLDALHERLVDRLSAEATERDTGAADLRGPSPRRTRPRGGHGLGSPIEAAHLLDRIDRTMAARNGASLAPSMDAAKDGAKDGADAPPPDRSGLGTVRAALYHAVDDCAEEPSLALRMAAHTLNAAIMVVALPIGAAMMTYGLLRGADLRTSAQAAALCGIGMGAMDAVGGLPGLRELLVFRI